MYERAYLQTITINEMLQWFVIKAAKTLRVFINDTSGEDRDEGHICDILGLYIEVTLAVQIPF